MTTTMQHNERAFQHADKAIAHYTRLLLGAGLTRTDKDLFRRLLVRAVFARAEALQRMEREEIAA
jgi:hypothetical protein